MGFDLVSRILFPTPNPSYGPDSFPDQLIWVPRNLHPEGATPEACVPCLFLPYLSARFVVIYLHSNAEDLGRCRTFCSNLRAQFQVHVLAVEYPGYGICPGGPCDEVSATENALVALRFAMKVLQVPLDSIIVLGRSIGSGIAISLALEHQVAGVIAVSPMLSVREVCKDVLGPLSWAVTERFPNKERVEKMQSPFMVVHGQKDAIVPCRHGVELYEACRSRKLLICPKEFDHNSNLLADISYLVLPMLQFFSLPDYCFDEMPIPSWLYDRTMCPFYDPGDKKSQAAEGEEKPKASPVAASSEATGTRRARAAPRRPAEAADEDDIEVSLREEHGAREVAEHTANASGCRLFGVSAGVCNSTGLDRSRGGAVSSWSWACNYRRESGNSEAAEAGGQQDLVLDVQPVLEPQDLVRNRGRGPQGFGKPQADEVPMERPLGASSSSPRRSEDSRQAEAAVDAGVRWTGKVASEPRPPADAGADSAAARATAAAGAAAAAAEAPGSPEAQRSMRQLESRVDLLLDQARQSSPTDNLHQHLDQLMKQLSDADKARGGQDAVPI
eukprot:TRINITY_DN5561_c0_g4_i1.p1 TRINITY_DN5561_c0_g4~~TRINITY_DN5561_c0_g4_i1.p1  ORF type:complete len:558 (-),score=100.90 TRINITY_DN5561_c0_g4_i1:110-1783(-)